MTPYKIRKKAEEFEISYLSAVTMRIKYLLDILPQSIAWVECGTNDLPEYMPFEIIDQIHALKKSLKRPKTSLTDEMIEHARTIPIDRIIEFTRGKTRCLNHDHEDSNPSAYHGTRSNRLVCPVCDTKHDTITIQMQLTGQNFKEAVIDLCKSY